MKRFSYLCTIILSTVSLGLAVEGEPNNLEANLLSRDDIVFYGGFESEFGSSAWDTDWGIGFTNRADQVEILTGTSAFIGSKSIRVDYPAGGVGPTQTGTQFPINFEDISNMPVKAFDSLYLRYYVKFENGFDFKLGGKLPGLMGGNRSWGRSGGNQPDGTNGWTLRFMWRRDGEAVVYTYLPTGTKYSTSQWGTDIKLNKHFETGKWHCLEQFCKVNTVGREDGKLYVWMDGERVLTLDDVTYRTVDNTAGKVGGIYFSTFHGGNSSDWAPSVTSYAQYDGIVAGTRRIGMYQTDPLSLLILTRELPDAMAGFGYNQTFLAENGSGPYTWSISAESLPEGLNLSSNGTLSGTPEQSGTHTFTVQVTDAQNETSSVELTLTVNSSEGMNIANEWTYLESEGLDLSNPAQGLWDGDITDAPAACPGSQNSSTFWVLYDLGSVFDLTQVRLHGDADGSWYSSKYTVEIKEKDSDSWTKLIDNEDCFSNEWFETATSEKARLVKLTVVGNETEGKVQIREFEVYGTTAVTSLISTKPSSFSQQDLSVKWLPSAAVLTVTGISDPLKADFAVYDMTGRRMYITGISHTSDGAILNLSGLAKRNYLVTITKGNTNSVLKVTP